jgi:hypothetical protein
MKKLLLPFEAGHYPRELLDFIANLQPMAPVQLTAAFVRESDYASLAGVRELPAAVPVSCYGDEERMLRYNRRRLEQYCENLGIRLTVHADGEDFALACLRRESRYADLMLINSTHFFEDLDNDQPNAWMKEMLHGSECPVLLMPDKISLPGELILAYDGSAASVFAIRQFAYLFPEFCRVQATLFYVNEDPAAKIPEEEAIRELCALHFKKFRVVKGRVRSAGFYDSWLGMMSNPWLVTGSFARSALSHSFSASFSKELIMQHRVPVFVAHK